MNSSFAVKHANICKCISKWNEKFIFIPWALYIKIVLAKITAKFVSKMCIVTSQVIHVPKIPTNGEGWPMRILSFEMTEKVIFKFSLSNFVKYYRNSRFFIQK